MHSFGLVSSNMCITYSMCPCNKLWRHLECLNIYTIKVNRPSTKQLLHNFLGWCFRKAETIFGARVKNGLFIKKGVRNKNCEKQKFENKNCGSCYIFPIYFKFYFNFPFPTITFQKQNLVTNSKHIWWLLT